MEHDAYVGDEPALPPRPRPLLRRPVVWIGAGAPLVIAATVSWFMAGNTTWGMGALGGIVLGALISMGALRAVLAAPSQVAWKATGIVVGYVVLLLAAWIVPGYFFPLTQVRVKPPQDGPEGRTRVAYRGYPVGEFQGTEEYRFSLRGHLDAAALTVETWGPNGWTRRPFRDFVAVELEKVPTTCLYVDNRDHAAVHLDCGELRLEIPANAAETHFILVPKYGKSALLSIDGENVGSLDDGFFLVDVLGTRHYSEKEVAYKDGLSASLAILGHRPLPEERTKPAVAYHGRRLHVLERKVDYFLQPAPENITVRTFGLGMQDEHRVQLQEVERP